MKIIAAKRGLAISALLGEVDRTYRLEAELPSRRWSAVTHRKGAPKIGGVAVVRADDLLEEGSALKARLSSINRG